jgi:hypothetical protein
VSVAEERLKMLEAEIIRLRDSLEKLLSSTSVPLATKKKNSSKLLDLFGEWDGDIEDFFHEFYERRERRGRSE